MKALSFLKKLPAPYLITSWPHPIPYEVEWDILGTDKPFNAVAGVCRLCLLEAYFFMFDEASSTLNTKDEYWSICVHKKYFLLDKV